MGPLLLSRILELEDAQAGLMDILFHVADEQGLLLLDLDDLQSMVAEVGENAKEIGLKYGNVAPATVASVQRKILSLRTQGGANLFGEPALRLEDLMRTSIDGRGYVNLLAADRLITSPKLYATFLLWLLSELFEVMPEVGDQPKPRLAFFFDEAHLLFTDAPKSLLQKIEQVVRLIRSKGVSVWFVTQSPTDIPESVLAQLGTRVQHALRAYTPNEQEALRLASRSFRPNPAFDTAEAIQNLGVGEALVSTLDEKGAPTMVARTRIRPPASRIGPATSEERAALLAASPVTASYATLVNRESAHEKLKVRAEAEMAEVDRTRAAEQAQKDADLAAKAAEKAHTQAEKEAERARREAEREAARIARERTPRARTRETVMEATLKSVARQAGSQITRELMRGILGGLRRR